MTDLKIGESYEFYFDDDDGMDGLVVSLDRHGYFRDNANCTVLDIQKNEYGQTVLHLECEDRTQNNDYILV